MKKVKFGDQLLQQMYDYIIRKAASNKTVTYKEMGDHFGIDYRHENLGRYLGEISAETYDKLGFFVSAIVISAKEGSPGGGFFNLAADCGAEFFDKDSFWADQMLKSVDYAKKITAKTE